MQWALILSSEWLSTPVRSRSKRSLHLRAASVVLFMAMAATCCAQVSATTKPKSSRRVQDVTFRSASLKRDTTYRVILPADYHRGDRRYPTVVLLHGLVGAYTNWETHTDIVAYSEKLPFIIVLPDGANSWWVNAAEIPDDKYEDFVAKDLSEDVDRRFRTIQARQGRFIGGLSMGGYGALKFAIRTPGRYAAVGSFSGAFGVPSDESYFERYKRYDIAKVYGPEDSETRKQNDVLALMGKANPASFPYLYLAAGAGDTLVLQSNRDLAVTLSSRGFRYEYHEVPGTHEWPLWDREMKNFLDLANDMFQRSKRRR